MGPCSRISRRRPAAQALDQGLFPRLKEDEAVERKRMPQLHQHQPDEGALEELVEPRLRDLEPETGNRGLRAVVINPPGWPGCDQPALVKRMLAWPLTRGR